MTAIDKIALREQSQKLDRHIRQTQEVLDTGKQAGEALMWFAEYGKTDTRPPHEVIRLKAEMVGQTFNAAKAERYVTLALLEVREKIIERAIELAQADFKNARELVR